MKRIGRTDNGVLVEITEDLAREVNEQICRLRNVAGVLDLLLTIEADPAPAKAAPAGSKANVSHRETFRKTPAKAGVSASRKPRKPLSQSGTSAPSAPPRETPGASRRAAEPQGEKRSRNKKCAQCGMAFYDDSKTNCRKWCGPGGCAKETKESAGRIAAKRMAEGSAATAGPQRTTREP
jgi:predicted RNA-binding Zn ribbon-like protein